MHSYLGNLSVEERMRVMAENEAREKDYLASQEQRREHERITRQRQEMEQHLTERGVRYLEQTGAQPSADLVATWTKEYADQKEHEHEADNRRRYEDAGYDEAGQRDTVF